jgi:hypothetical protein
MKVKHSCEEDETSATSEVRDVRTKVTKRKRDTSVAPTRPATTAPAMSLGSADAAMFFALVCVVCSYVTYTDMHGNTHTHTYILILARMYLALIRRSMPSILKKYTPTSNV